MFKQTLQARRKRRRWVAQFLALFGAADLDTTMTRTLRTNWGHEDREGYGA